MHTSEVLNNEIFGKQPRISKLQQEIDSILSRFSPERASSPKIQEALSRINSISETLASISDETRTEIVELYQDTVFKKHLNEYSGKVAVLEEHQRKRVYDLLNASNDEHFSQVA